MAKPIGARAEHCSVIRHEIVVDVGVSIVQNDRGAALKVLDEDIIGSRGIDRGDSTEIDDRVTDVLDCDIDWIIARCEKFVLLKGSNLFNRRIEQILHRGTPSTVIVRIVSV